MVGQYYEKHTIAENIAEIKSRIRDAAQKSGRHENEVTLVAVSKFHPLEEIVQAVNSGICLLGESRVQEAKEKKDQWSAEPVKWHLIGNLQRNKVRKALEVFDLIQSVDSLLLASMMNRVLDEADKKEYPIFIEINAGGELSKKGTTPESAEQLINSIQASCPNLKVMGAMMMAPLGLYTDELRAMFRNFREMVENLRVRCGLPLPEISMGMSGDFEIAIEEGSTLVRVGTAIFGERHL